MGKRSRNIKLDNEWKTSYCREATSIIEDLYVFIGEQIPPKLNQRILRLKAASVIDVYVPPF